jgi:hypothetical protein
MLSGVTHIHSKYSFDGRLELREVQALFEERGCDFVLMSEHIEEMRTDDVCRFIDDCRRYSTDRCLLIPGIEMDALHILIFGAKEGKLASSLLESAEQFREQGALIVLSHPIKLRRGIPEGIEAMLSGVEVWNCRYDGKWLPRLSNVRLLNQLRVGNPKLVATCGIDFHSRSDYADVRMEVETNERSERQILNAIRTGRVRITRKGRPIAFDGGKISRRRSVVDVESQLYTGLYDLVHAQYRWLKERGIHPPATLRKLVRRLF